MTPAPFVSGCGGGAESTGVSGGAGGAGDGSVWTGTGRVSESDRSRTHDLHTGGEARGIYRTLQILESHTTAQSLISDKVQHQFLRISESSELIRKAPA